MFFGKGVGREVLRKFVKIGVGQRCVNLRLFYLLLYRFLFTNCVGPIFIFLEVCFLMSRAASFKEICCKGGRVKPGLNLSLFIN